MVFEIGVAMGMLAMETLDGHPVTMANYSERSGTVVLFLSSRCPVTHEMIPVINDAYERTRLNEVLFVGLCANDSETGTELLTFAQRHGVRFPVYRDRSGTLAKQFGVRRTLEAVLLDDKGAAVWRGSFHNAEAARAAQTAIDALLAGKPPVLAAFPGGGTPIDDPGRPMQSEDVFGTLAFSSELIFEHIPEAPAHHCSTLAEAVNGDLVCVWYGGSYESSDDQVLFISRKKPGERHWSVPEVLVKGAPFHPPGNAVVFRAGPKRLMVIWGRMDATRPIRRGSGWNRCQLMMRYSDDNGHTWSPDEEMTGLFGSLPRNVPITLQDGTLAVPLSGRTQAGSGGFLLMTRDGGATWRQSGFMNRGSQPTVIQRNDGVLLALLRSEPNILQSQSTDFGATWTAPEPIDLKCPGSGIAMCRLANGHLVLVFNHSTERSPLNIARSTDEGATWGEVRVLEANPGEYSYPCVIQTSDGRIHITYTYRRYSIKHVEINEDWLVHLDRPN